MITISKTARLSALLAIALTGVSALAMDKDNALPPVSSVFRTPSWVLGHNDDKCATYLSYLSNGELRFLPTTPINSTGYIIVESQEKEKAKIAIEIADLTVLCDMDKYKKEDVCSKVLPAFKNYYNLLKDPRFILKEFSQTTNK